MDGLLGLWRPGHVTFRDASFGGKIHGIGNPRHSLQGHIDQGNFVSLRQSITKFIRTEYVAMLRRHNHDAMREKVGRVRVQLWVCIS